MNKINIIITTRNSEGGGVAIAQTTKDKVIIDRCDACLPEHAFNKPSSSIFYCISSKDSGLLIQQIRRTAGRSGTYNVFSILIPTGKIISSPICPIFNKINEIYQNTPAGGKLDNLLLDYADEVAIEDYLGHDLFAQDNSFAYRIIDNDIENVLHNPIQAEYKKYEYILLVDVDDKICDSSEHKLSNLIDSKRRYAVESQYIERIEFKPKVRSFECYSSELSSKSVIYTALGFEDVKKQYKDKITVDDIYYSISRNEMSINPSAANVTCNLGESNNGKFIIPYANYNKAIFTIEKEGYESQKVTSHDINSGKTIHLTPCKEECSLQIYNSDKLICISFKSIEKPIDFPIENAMIAPSFLEKEFNRLKKWRFVLLIVCLIIFILGFAVGHYMPTSPNQSAEGYASDTIEVDRDYQKKQSIEDYLASDKWNTTNIAELNGLFQAMNRFSYEDIKTKYNNLKQTYDIGKLQEVIDEIKKYNNIRKPTENYTTLKTTTEIDVSKWVEEVKNVNYVSSSPQNTEKEMIERYLAQSYWNKSRCSDNFERQNGKTKEPDGLWEAMRMYDLATIKAIYKKYRDKGYNVGKLEDVVMYLEDYKWVVPSGYYKNLSDNPGDGKGPISIEQWKKSLGKIYCPRGCGMEINKDSINSHLEDYCATN